MYLHSDEQMDFFNIYHPQKGGEYFPIYQSNLGRQRGHGIGGIFQNLSRFLKPLLEKYVLPHAARAVRNAAVDIVDNNRSWKEVVKEQGVQALKGVGKDILDQSGSGRGRKRKKYNYQKIIVTKKRKTIKKKNKSRKKTKKKSKQVIKTKRVKKFKSIFDY